MKVLCKILSYRLVNALLVLASVVGIGFALYLQKYQHLEPCPLCIFQRIGLIAMGIVAFIALLHNPKYRLVRALYSFVSFLGIGWSVAIAARHVWIQSLPPDKVPACGAGLEYMIDTLPFQEVVQEVLTGSGECAKIDWTFLGFSLPVWSLVFFSVLLLINIWQIFRRS